MPDEPKIETARLMEVKTTRILNTEWDRYSLRTYVRIQKVEEREGGEQTGRTRVRRCSAS